MTRRPQTTQIPHGWLWPVFSVILIPAMLACAFMGSQPTVKHLVRLTRLATLTPTAVSSTPQPVEEPAIVSTTPIPAPNFTPANQNRPAAQDNDSPLLTALVDLNVRAGPGLDYAIIGQLGLGQSTPIVGKNLEESWWQIIYPLNSGSLGWVSANPQYVSVSHAAGLPVAQGPPLPSATVIPTSLPTASPTLMPTPEETPTPSNWSFASIRTDASQEKGNLLLYGNMVNISASPQEVAYVTGTFYNAQGQVIADEESTYDYWLVDLVPPGGRIPFELTISGIENAANLNLRVKSEPRNETPRQNFDFSDVSTSNEAGDYCVAGTLRNPGDELDEYLIVVAILYDHWDQVINFSDYDEANPDEIVGDQTSDFEICVDRLGQDVARYELQAWGL